MADMPCMSCGKQRSSPPPPQCLHPANHRAVKTDPSPGQDLKRVAEALKELCSTTALRGYERFHPDDWIVLARAALAASSPTDGEQKGLSPEEAQTILKDEREEPLTPEEFELVKSGWAKIRAAAGRK